MIPALSFVPGRRRRIAAAVLAVGLSGSACSPSSIGAQQPAPKSAVAFDPALFSGLEYRWIGPSRGGRVTAVEGVRQQPNVFYFGATGGGVWKSDDYGANWRNISDGYFATGSIGAIEVADSDPDIIYVGTGSDGLRSNIIAGKGVYKSTDAGETWTHVGLRDVGQIGAVEAHPTNPDIVFVAAIGHAFGPNPERGVFRSTDGGASWEKVLFVSDSTGAVDIEFAPDDPNTVYATMWRAERKPWTIISGAREGGVFKSTDGGDTWTKLGGGLPDGVVGKIDLAVSAADPDVVYALVEALPPEGGLYRSDDRGETWTAVNTTEAGLLDRPFYYLNVTADPTNPDKVFVAATAWWVSEDGGRTFERRRTPHGDNHDLWINPDDPDILIQSNDGGANVSLNGGRTWSTQDNQPTAELYQIDIDDRFPYWVYAGQQDNGTAIAVPSLPTPLWSSEVPAIGRAVGGCETGPAVPRPGDPDIVYANCKGRFTRLSLRTGQEKQYYVGAQFMYGHNPKDLKYRFQRVSPIEVSPHDSNVVYHASQYLHRTTDEGVTWETISPDLTANDPRGHVISGSPITRDVTGEEFYSTIYAVEESPLVEGLIWVGSNDGLVHVTRDGGESWQNVTPKDLPPGGRVQNIEPSPHDPAKAYVAVYRYLVADDWAPYIYRTTDYGRTWTRLTDGENGIPADYPTRVVREDPDREGLLYAGTEFGIFISFDDGASWQPFQQNLPVTPVTDIEVYRKDLVVSTMGRGFWILDNVTPLHQLSDEVAGARAYLFQPRAAYRLRYRARGGGPADPEYPEPGAMIDYYLASDDVGPVTLEILDADGDLVRGFSSEAPGEQTVLKGTMHDWALETVGTPRLPTGKGMHRFTWDLSHPGPWHPNARRSGRNGPMVLPGTYQVRLTVGDWTQTRTLEVRMDPRVVDDGVTRGDLAEQLEHAFRVRDAISEANLALDRVRNARERLEAAGRSASDAARRLDALRAALETADGRYMQPMLIDQLEYLYGMITDADQKLGRDAFIRYDELRAELDRILAELQAVEGRIAADR
ncbi:MAG TPA: hypothetical protein VF212_08345 [Longimicrobiales bacterium]